MLMMLLNVSDVCEVHYAAVVRGASDVYDVSEVVVVISMSGVVCCDVVLVVVPRCALSLCVARGCPFVSCCYVLMCVATVLQVSDFSCTSAVLLLF